MELRRTEWTLATLAEALAVDWLGEGSLPLSRVATLGSAQAGSLSFLANSHYRHLLATTSAAAVILHPSMVENCPVAMLVSENPYLTYAKASHLFDCAPLPREGVHPSAVVADTVQLGQGVSIGARAVIEAGVVLDQGVVIGPGSVVGAGSVIGEYTRLHANVTLYHGVRLGGRCVVHSGAVIGADGFGFANDKGRWIKIAQLGSVCIGDDVEIGANTTIDRGAIGDTTIGNGVILDNQIQIAHNVEIGDFTAIAGCTGIAGSTKIGRYCTIAGGVGIAGHLVIGDRVHITMRTDVTGSLPEAGSYSSGTAVSETKVWRKNAARFRQLDSLARRITALERKAHGNLSDTEGEDRG